MAGVRWRGRTWQIWYVNAEGKRVFTRGFTDRKKSLQFAKDLEHEAARIKQGLSDPHAKTRRTAAEVTADYLVGEWHKSIVHGGSTERHADGQASACRKLLGMAGVEKIPDANYDAINRALHAILQERSTRTRNYTLAAFKSFWRWLETTDRIATLPRWFKNLKSLNEQADRKLVRRALTQAETHRLYAATSTAPDLLVCGPSRNPATAERLTGPERALLYRLAIGTGFRANELRTLTRDAFRLDSDPPTVTVLAAYAKNGRTVEQQIGADLAAYLREWFAAGRPVPKLPRRTADMLRADLTRAAIPVETGEGRMDFHGLRHTYISRVVQSGVSVKVAQELARHSTPVLTIGRYAHAGKDEKRKALDGIE